MLLSAYLLSGILVHRSSWHCSRTAFSVDLHAIHHESREIKEGTWIPETEYLAKGKLKKGIIEGREYLERIFGITIDT